MTRTTTAILSAIFGALFLTAGIAEAQAPRIGYVNSQRILAEAPATETARQQFETAMQAFADELGGMEDRLESLQENLERQQATLTPAVRQERQQEIQQLFIQYQQRSMEVEGQMQELQSELLGPIMERIYEAIEVVRAEQNYAIIFDAASGAIATADQALDISPMVLERLRTQ
jgi:outer membrane protein